MSTLHEEVGGCYSTAGCHVEGGPSMVIGCGGTEAALSCHVRGVNLHPANPSHHVGIETGDDGGPQAGACVAAGCHVTTNVADLHTPSGGCWETPGCHVEGGPSMVIGCGGTDDTLLACHNSPTTRSVLCVIPGRVTGTSVVWLQAHEPILAESPGSSATTTPTSEIPAPDSVGPVPVNPTTNDDASEEVSPSEPSKDDTSTAGG
jgi:hypothetical protein